MIKRKKIIIFIHLSLLNVNRCFALVLWINADFRVGNHEKKNITRPQFMIDRAHAQATATAPTPTATTVKHIIHDSKFPKVPSVGRVYQLFSQCVDFLTQNSYSFIVSYLIYYYSKLYGNRINKIV